MTLSQVDRVGNAFGMKLGGRKMKIITREELLEKMRNKEAFALVDVLTKESYAHNHIEGAVNLPVGELAELAPTRLPDKNQEIICYCASFDCQASTSAGRILEKLGYTNVLDYKGGLKDWRAAGYPMASSLTTSGVG
jgi:rhodanese-related sulfurtransferase